jgi:predicted amidohydrolase YtcJ
VAGRLRSPAVPAELALLGGPIFTAGSHPGSFTALAVDGGVISYLGDDEGVRAHIGPGTNVIDLGGRMATPGFQDAHCHPSSSGLDLARCSLGEARSAEEALAAIASYAGAHPDEAWIRGSGWSSDWFDRGCPPKELLDSVVGDRPVYLPNRDGHSAWVSTAALRAAGVDSSTPDPFDGRIERNPDGSPQGTMHEGARYLITDHMPEDTDAEIRAGIVAGQRYLFGRGITAWQDAHVDDPVHRAYRALGENGDLEGRVAGALWWDRHLGMEQLQWIESVRHEASGRYRPVAVKLMVDGVVENFTASMLDPYLDGAGGSTGNRGIDFIDPSDLAEIVTRLDATGLSCHFHAIGDRGVRNALDAVAAARAANGMTANRHHIAHIQVVHPDDIARFVELGVTANCQTLWACDGGYQTDLTKPFLGQERTSWQYPFGSLAAAGAHLAMGSDWDVSTPDIFDQADVAVTRSDIADPSEPPLNLAEAITLAASLTGFTLGSAYVNHIDDTTGTLEVGKLADLVVLDCDPFQRERVAGTLVDLTVIEGRIVYER